MYKYVTFEQSRKFSNDFFFDIRARPLKNLSGIYQICIKLQTNLRRLAKYILHYFLQTRNVFSKLEYRLTSQIHECTV